MVSFFATIPLPPAAERYIGEILQLKWWRHHPPGFLLELDRVRPLMIRALKFTESSFSSATPEEYFSDPVR